MEKKYYVAPRMEETELSTVNMLALSGDHASVFPGIEKDANESLANPFRRSSGF